MINETSGCRHLLNIFQHDLHPQQFRLTYHQLLSTVRRHQILPSLLSTLLLTNRTCWRYQLVTGRQQTASANLVSPPASLAVNLDPSNVIQTTAGTTTTLFQPLSQAIRMVTVPACQFSCGAVLQANTAPISFIRKSFFFPGVRGPLQSIEIIAKLPFFLRPLHRGHLPLFIMYRFSYVAVVVEEAEEKNDEQEGDHAGKRDG
jgi:hypothetical protein